VQHFRQVLDPPLHGVHEGFPLVDYVVHTKLHWIEVVEFDEFLAHLGLQLVARHYHFGQFITLVLQIDPGLGRLVRGVMHGVNVVDLDFLELVGLQLHPGGLILARHAVKHVELLLILVDFDLVVELAQLEH